MPSGVIQQYYQLNSESDGVFEVRLPQVRSGLHYNRYILSDQLYGPVEPTLLAKLWIKYRLILLCIVTIAPIIFLPYEIIRKAWITSVFGLIACCLPSGGAPIAGGIVFIPCLQMLGLSGKQTVAFCSATQMFGCGIFAPLNWYAKDPGIFIKSTLLICLPAGTIGLFLSLFCYSVDEEQVNVIFGVFCLFLIGTVIYGLFHDLTTHDEPITFKVKSWKDIGTILLYFVCSLIGGMIAGWIGIGIEKIYFLLATSYHRAELKRATITAITIIGWLSTISAFIHFFILRDVPIPYWVCSIPGVLLGSIIGPTINAYIGSSNVMIIFCIFLFLNVVYELHKNL